MPFALSTHGGAGPFESPPAHAFGRFQFFVLRKREGGSAAGGKRRTCPLFDALAAGPESSNSYTSFTCEK